MNWNEDTHTKFNSMIAKVPGPMQKLAQDMVTKKATELCTQEGRDEISEKDMVDAFFDVTPFGFHGPMKCDMEALDIHYEQYGYER